MGLRHFDVNEAHIADESHVGSFQVTAEYAVVETRHEKESGHARFGHSHEANKRAQETVEEEVEVAQNEVEVGVFEQEGFVRFVRVVDEEIAAQIPDEDSFEYVYCDYWEEDFRQVFCDEVEFDQEADDDC